MDITSEEQLHKAREYLTRARYYRSAQYAVEAADALSVAAAICYELSNSFSMSLHDRRVVDAVMRIWVDGDAGSDDIMAYLPRGGHGDSGIEAITTLRADMELEQNHWSCAATSYSYALLANRRRHKHPVWTTFKLLHGLGRAFQGQQLFQRAERTYRIVFAGYMQLGPFGKVHDMEMRALLDDWEESQNVQKQMVRQQQWTCSLIAWALVLIFVPAPEWRQIRDRLYLTVAVATYIPRRCAVARDALYEWLRGAIIDCIGVLCEHWFGKPL